MLAAWFVALLAWPAHALDERTEHATVRVFCLTGFDVETHPVGQSDVPLAVAKLVRGSGFVVGKKGVVVTTEHVVHGAKFVFVLVPGVSNALPAKVVHTDEKLDVAFLRVLDKLPVRADWKNPKKLEADQTVIAVGYPRDSRSELPELKKGSVSSPLPDGKEKLSLASDAGYFGAPLVDEQGRVQAVVVLDASAEDGGSNMAVATPLRSFQRELTREVYNARQGELDDLGQAYRVEAARLLALEHEKSTSLLELATQIDSPKAKEAEEKLRGLSKLAAKNPTLAMFMAAFFWNQHLALAAAGRPADSPRTNAKTLVETALHVDPSYSSSFTEWAKSDRPAVRVVAQQETQTAPAQAGLLRTVRFEAPAGVSLLARHGQLQSGAPTQKSAPPSTDFYERICQGSCDLTFRPGEFELALSLNEGQAVPLQNTVQLDGSADVQARYVDRSGTRTAGLLVFLGGVVGGTLLAVVSLVPNCDRSGAPCERNNLGVVAGAAALGLGIGFGLPMMFTSDEVGVQLLPHAPTRSGAPAARAGLGAPLHLARQF